MSDHESDRHDPLEAALRRLTPLSVTLDRDRLLFRAGQMSGRRSRWRLALLAALVGVGTGMAGSYLGAAKTPEAAPRIVVVHVPVPTPVAPPSAFEVPKEPETPASPVQPAPLSAGDSFFHMTTPASGYLHLRDQALRWGVESVPMTVPTSPVGQTANPTNWLQMHDEWLK